MSDDIIAKATRVVNEHMTTSGLEGHIPTEAEGGYHVATRREKVKARITAIHWPIVGHRFAPAYLRKRPGMYCGRCNQKR